MIEYKKGGHETVRPALETVQRVESDGQSALREVALRRKWLSVTLVSMILIAGLLFAKARQIVHK